VSYITDHKQKFEDLNSNIEHQNQLKRQANGGNSIIFSYPPNEESLYIEKAKELYPNAAFIDIAALLVKFIDRDGWDVVKDYYNDFKNTPNIVFHSDDPEPDLFDLILQGIEQASKDGKIPFLIRTGCLFGTGIENVNIMEHKTVMSLPHPLVIFYPSSIEDGNLLFLNFKAASKYRCILVK